MPAHAERAVAGNGNNAPQSNVFVQQPTLNSHHYMSTTDHLFIPLPLWLPVVLQHKIVPVHECMGEDPDVVRICRSRYSHVVTEGIVAESAHEDVGPAARVHDGVIVDLIEVVTTVVVRLLYQLAHHPGRCVLLSRVHCGRQNDIKHKARHTS